MLSLWQIVLTLAINCFILWQLSHKCCGVIYHCIILGSNRTTSRDGLQVAREENIAPGEHLLVECRYRLLCYLVAKPSAGSRTSHNDLSRRHSYSGSLGSMNHRLARKKHPFSSRSSGRRSRRGRGQRGWPRTLLTASDWRTEPLVYKPRLYAERMILLTVLWDATVSFNSICVRECSDFAS